MRWNLKLGTFRFLSAMGRSSGLRKSCNHPMSMEKHVIIINYPTNETLKEFLLCHNFLRVGVMSIKVYIFGEDIFCIIHL